MKLVIFAISIAISFEIDTYSWIWVSLSSTYSYQLWCIILYLSCAGGDEFLLAYLLTKRVDFWSLNCWYFPHTVIMIHINIFGLNPTVIECESLSNPANGMVTVTGLTPGSIATYTCNNAYQLLGNDTRTCDSNGLWTNMEPTCVRKYLIIIVFSCTNWLCFLRVYAQIIICAFIYAWSSTYMHLPFILPSSKSNVVAHGIMQLYVCTIIPDDRYMHIHDMLDLHNTHEVVYY